MTATMTYPKVWNADQLSRPVAGGERTPGLVAGETFDAISMPASFGALVHAELDIMMLAGPVVADEDEGSWTFLTQRADTPHPTVPADLLRRGVRPVPAGTPIAPLAAADRPDRAPEIWSTVIGAARRVAYRTRCAV